MPQISFWNLLKTTQIRIPIIQRDYAQGRKTVQIEAIRELFVSDLHSALNRSEPLNLDFIFGEATNHEFIPFDGQQRLTTLFLLHWYAAASKNILSDNEDEIRKTLSKFCYEVREDTRIFVLDLLDSDISEDHPCQLEYDDNCTNSLSKFIQDEPWFHFDWMYDPTISGMLTMLDSIHKHFHLHAKKGLWDILAGDNCPVTFDYEELSKLSLTADEMYIKMNARGKLLTEFENFKADFLKKIAMDNDNLNINIDELAVKFDNEWINFFWKTFAKIENDKVQGELYDVNKASKTDGCFVGFLRFLTEIFTRWDLNKTDTIEPYNYNVDLCESFFQSIQSKNMDKLWPDGNFAFMVTLLDKFVLMYDNLASPQRVEKNNTIDHFINDKFFTLTPSLDTLPQQGKISIHSKQNINPFFDCCISGTSNDKKSNLSFKDKHILFAIFLIIANNIGHDDASIVLRILRNILENSENELNEENFPQQLRDVHNLVVHGIESIGDKSKFNREQIIEEKAKFKYRLENKNDTDLIMAMDFLEDHALLQGCLAIFSDIPKEEGKNNEQLYIFNKDLIMSGKHFFKIAFGTDRIDFVYIMEALLSKGNYGYRYWPQRVFLGTPGNLNDESRDYNTHLILTSHNQSNKPYFPERCKCVQELINETKSVNSTTDLEKMLTDIVRSFLDKCETNKEFSWRYYFLKYPKYDGSGLYYWGYTKQSFNQITLSKQKRSANSWSTFLRAATSEAGLNEKYKEEDENLGGIDSPTSETQPLMFKKIKLSLWCDEFSWKIWDMIDKTKTELSQDQHDFFKRLTEEYPRIQEDGWLHIVGKDSGDKKIDYTHHNIFIDYRIYDKEDRIKLIVPIIKFLYEMNSE